MIASTVSVPDNLSSMEWKGSRPKRFEIGRRHVHPPDQLNFRLEGKEQSPRGKKHYDARYSSQVMNPYGSTKMFPDKYHRSEMFDVVDLKKLVYVPMNKLKFPNLQKGDVTGGNLTKLQELKLGIRKHGIYRNFAKQRVFSLNREAGSTLPARQQLPSILSQQI